MRCVLFDANIILDVLLKREGLFGPSAVVLSFCDSKIVEGYISVTCLPLIFYLIRKNEGLAKAKTVLRELLITLKIACIKEEGVHYALDSRSNDFEDALIIQTAVEIKADAIITRDRKDFKNYFMNTYSPEEFIEIVKH